MITHQGPWRRPAVESVGLYPDLVVADNRVTGSITVGQSRLPVWAFVTTAIHHDWTEVEAGWSPTENYGFTADHLAAFLYDLLELRGEFGRLLLVLAAAERYERTNRRHLPWWDTKKHRKQVATQLRLCLQALDDPEPHAKPGDTGASGP